METTLANIYGKESDYKICKSCKSINWYENKECIKCEGSKFDNNKKHIEKWVDDEIQYYIKEEGWTYSEAEDVLTDI